MPETAAPLYNLVFSGQLLPDVDVQRAHRTLATFFGLQDAAAVETFFTGKKIPLRRNLQRDDARRLYQQLRAVGLICEIRAASVATESDESGAAEPLTVPARGLSTTATPETKATAETKATTRAKPTESARPAGRTKTVSETKPAGGTKTASKTKPATRGKTASSAKPATSAKPKASAKAKASAQAKASPKQAASRKSSTNAGEENKPKARPPAKRPPKPKSAAKPQQADEPPQATAAPQAVEPAPPASTEQVDNPKEPAAPKQAATRKKTSRRRTANKTQSAAAAKPTAKSKGPGASRRGPPTARKPLAAAVPDATLAPAPVSQAAAPEASKPARPPQPTQTKPPGPAPAPAPAAKTATPKAPKAAPAPVAKATSSEPPKAPPAPAAKPAPAELPKAEPGAAPQKISPVTGEKEASPPQAAVRGRSTPRSDRPPNIFSLRPALNHEQRPRALEAAELRAMLATGIGAVLLVLMLFVALRLPAVPPGEAPLGPLALAVRSNNELVMLTGNTLLIHARSGLPKQRVTAEELGLQGLKAPLFALGNDELLFRGLSSDDVWRLQRCSLEERTCAAFFASLSTAAAALPDPAEIVAIASSYLGDSLYLLSAEGELMRSDLDGALQASAQLLTPPGHPRLLSNDGLLLLPATDGPLLGIYRPDAERFGTQLDALYLLSETATAKGHGQIDDIALLPASRWALLAAPPSGDRDTAAADPGAARSGLYRFDQSWGNATAIELPEEYSKGYLQSWRDKLLIASPDRREVLRFADSGQREADLDSEMLARERADWLENARLSRLMRIVGLTLPGSLLGLAVLAALLYRAERSALRSMPTQRTALLDPLPSGIVWQALAGRHEKQLKPLITSLLTTGFAAVIVPGLVGHWRVALAMLPFLLGIALAIRLLRQGSGGYLGLLQQRLIVMDHDGRYFYGERSLFRGLGTWLLAPGVALPLSVPAQQSTNAATPLLAANQHSSTLELLGWLWHLRHPWALALIAIAVGTVLSLSAVFLTQL